eukprot:CAMPEP_0177660308 /NCGR_PEP_ID=MMETSP0447-20121125/17961_1 /TAXON_ID=0 /ORGANISM="Stygamoeba regulata, Strain BSH-02190019" /LENGTH=446 /DNA_ID=CAMNT_0019165345 /DNA_START=76 /DNA_END=1414 /DNA_ORIENTATION=-
MNWKRVTTILAGLIVLLAVLVAYELNRTHDAEWKGPYQEPGLWIMNQILRLIKPTVPTSVDEVLEEARRRTGLTDLGAESDLGYAQALEGLGILLGAGQRLQREGAFTPLGRFAFGEGLIDGAVMRLRTIEAQKRHAEQLATLQLRPIFVVGLARSGTTFLYNLLAQDQRYRPLMLAEALTPALSAAQEAGDEIDDRFAHCHEKLFPLRFLNPRFRAIHESRTEECILLYGPMHTSYIAATFYDVPEYTAWLHEQDFGHTYRFHHLQLKLLHLQQNMTDRVWLLKAPFHLDNLHALVTEYPDAHIIWNHRKPQRSIASMTSLIAHIRNTYHTLDSINLTSATETAIAFATRALVGPRSAPEQRKKLGDRAHIIDVDYDRLVSDPLGTVQAIYDGLGFTLNEETRERMLNFLRQKPRHHLGTHRYEHLTVPEDRLPEDPFFGEEEFE